MASYRGNRSCQRPSIGSTILVEPRGHSGISLAETAGRNGDPDADRETPFGHRDYLARGHQDGLDTAERRLPATTTLPRRCELVFDPSRSPSRHDADLLSPSSRSWDPAAADVPGAVFADHGRAGIGLVPNRSGRLGRHNRGGIDLGLGQRQAYRGVSLTVRRLRLVPVHGVVPCAGDQSTGVYNDSREVTVAKGQHQVLYFSDMRAIASRH